MHLSTCLNYKFIILQPIISSLLLPINQRPYNRKALILSVLLCGPHCRGFRHSKASTVFFKVLKPSNNGYSPHSQILPHVDNFWKVVPILIKDRNHWAVKAGKDKSPPWVLLISFDDERWATTPKVLPFLFDLLIVLWGMMHLYPRASSLSLAYLKIFNAH